MVATPSAKEGMVYFPDWAGNLHAVDAKIGKAKWVKNFMTDYSHDPKMHGLIVNASRNTPAIDGDKLIIGSSVIHKNVENFYSEWRKKMNIKPLTWWQQLYYKNNLTYASRKKFILESYPNLFNEKKIEVSKLFEP